MTPSPAHAAFIAYCKEKIEEYQKVAFLQDYVIEFCEKPDKDNEGAFEIVLDVRYKRVMIHFKKNAIKSFKDGRLDFINRSILHELLHIPFHRLVVEAESRFTSLDDITWAKESAVDHFTNVVGRLAGIIK